VTEPLPGAIELPDGAWIRGRALRRPTPPGPVPAYALYLGSHRFQRAHEPELPWPHDWLDWPDFRLPRDPGHAIAAIRALHRRALSGEPVEVGCGGGVGRTGTALACLAVLSGLAPDEAIGFVRARHHPRAVETRGQRRWIDQFPVS
jgi:protein-tyrosine phosphatase